MRGWLTDEGSLTARLKARCPDFRVRRLRTAPGAVHPDETGLAGLHGSSRAYVREVLLMCDGRPVVFAHSVVPVQTLRGAWRELRRQGAKPLGETLFAQRGVARHPLSFRCLLPAHPLHRRLTHYLGRAPARLWARRSLFVREGAPLWVTEVFLPTVFELAP